MSTLASPIINKRSDTIDVISVIVGCIYVVSWSIAFYTQIYWNFVRKSVVGLNFDYVVLSLLGCFMYAFYICGLYFCEAVQLEFVERYGKHSHGVHANDVVYACHAFCASIYITYQCMVLEKEDQAMSCFGIAVSSVIYTLLNVQAFLAAMHLMLWLDVLYYCTMVKLVVAVIKYVPQVHMNYKRKSTSGESIHYIMLDFIGGTFSVTQMILDSYNDRDWFLTLREFPKFGVGLLALIFNVILLLQHFVFYSERYEEDEEYGQEEREEEEPEPD